VDTAGSRDTADVVEREGVLRGAEARGVADLVVVVVDGSEPATDDDRELLERTTRAPRLVVLNKHDRPLAGNWKDAEMGGELDRPVYVSAATGEGMPCLRRALVEALSGGEPLRDSAAVSNVRHISLLNVAREHLRRSGAAASAGATPEEFVLADLQAARGSLDEIVGRRTSDDILTHIFERFCIGK
jgi:tRNA modification GTPase